MLTLALALSCTKDYVESVSVEQQHAAKIIRMSDNNAVGSLIICFDDEAVTRVEAGVSRSESTRSGIASFDAILDKVGGSRMERVFISNRYEERLRSEGMHCWYVVYFDSKVNLDNAAAMFASVDEVSVVQLNSQIESIGGAEVPSVAAQPSSGSATRASKLYPAFNDPDLDKQWHYINIGDTNVFSGVKKGADINVGEAWDITAGDKRIIVAVVDNMVKPTHPDLAANMWVNEAEKNGVAGKDDDGNGYVDDIHGVNFVKFQYDGSTALTENESDHGTHVGGTIAAVNNNGIGGCGVAGGTGKGDGVRLMSCQTFHELPKNDPLFNTWPSGTDTGAARAFQYAADNGAAIANCSWGYPGRYTADSYFTPQNNLVRKGLDYFVQYGGGEVLDGGLPIFAAGNDKFDYPSYPGAYRDYICVTAMSCDYTPAYYTNYGPGSTLAAPGGDYLQKYYTDYTGEDNSSVYSTRYTNGANYGYMQGTSMACPHVSGIAALAISHSLQLGKKLTSLELRDILARSTHSIDQYCTGTKHSANGSSVVTAQLSTFKGKMGVGYIDAFKTLMNVEGIPCVTVRTGNRVTIDLSDVIGGNPTGMTDKDGYSTISVAMSQADRSKLGVEGDIVISKTGKLQLKCTKPGSAIATITFIAGGNAVGSNEATGGMLVSCKVAILSRSFATNGGWL